MECHIRGKLPWGGGNLRFGDLVICDYNECAMATKGVAVEFIFFTIYSMAHGDV